MASAAAEAGAFQEFRRRAPGYGKADWTAIRAEADAVTANLAAALRAGLPAGGAEATDVAERHRQHVSRHFYDCSYPMHRGLAGLYIDDPRFTAYYDAVEPGLARYVHDAIHARGVTVQAVAACGPAVLRPNVSYVTLSD